MKPDRKLNRRSFLGQVAGGAVGLGALGLVGSPQARAQTGPYTGVTDNDTGNNSDRPNHGRSAPRRVQGCSDNDSGSNADAAGNGRGNGRTDSDSSDPANCGRR